MISNRYPSLPLFLAALFLAVSATTYAQIRPGTLRLVVRDATDLTIPGASVTLTSSTGVARSATANERGEVLFESLPPGDYSARVEFPGFTSAEVKDLRMRAGAQTRSEERRVG